MKIVIDMNLSPLWVMPASQANAPSVFQLRTQDLLPDRIADLVVSILQQFEQELLAGALVSVDMTKARVRILPLR